MGRAGTLLLLSLVCLVTLATSTEGSNDTEGTSSTYSDQLEDVTAEMKALMDGAAHLRDKLKKLTVAVEAEAELKDQSNAITDQVLKMKQLGEGLKDQGRDLKAQTEVVSSIAKDHKVHGTEMSELVEVVEELSMEFQALRSSIVNQLENQEKKIEWSITDGSLAPRNSSWVEQKLDNMLTLIESLLKCQGCNQHEVSTPVPNGDGVSNCSKVNVSGVYTIVGSGPEFKAYCQVETDRKWTVIQRREDGSVDFYRKWEAYRLGFGQLTGEHWLGNDIIHALTASGHNQLRIDLEDWDRVKHTVYYDNFDVAGAEDKYRLTVSGFRGTSPPGDALTYNTGMMFTTQDQDNDSYSLNCAAVYTGAWWFASGCHYTNLNGVYKSTQNAKGVNWYQWKGYQYSLKRTVMMVK